MIFEVHYSDHKLGSFQLAIGNRKLTENGLSRKEIYSPHKKPWSRVIPGMLTEGLNSIIKIEISSVSPLSSQLGSLVSSSQAGSAQGSGRLSRVRARD